MDQPAFPTHGQTEGDDPRNQILTGGMTLRDYFAAAALQGLLAGRSAIMEPKWYSREAAELADAMIAEREKRDAED